MKIFFDMVGCRLNQSEIEKMAAQVRQIGHEVVSNASQADTVVVNTCAVTQAASSDSRQKIRQAAHTGKARIVATGCYATIDPDEIAQLPSVEWLVPNLEKDELVNKIFGVQTDNKSKVGPRLAIPGKRQRTRAFIKVQDGCNNYCTFCITRIARGKNKSQPVIEIFQDIESALSGGVNEIVLTGVNIGAWGHDLEGNPTLFSLIKKIISKFSPERLRLSSLEPWDIKDEIFEVLTLPGFCRHLHLPLQSGSGGVLKRMGRRNSPLDYEVLLEKIRKVIPEIAITTDIMVGFPAESQDEFSESFNFVRRMRFAGGHVFNFSIRPGTAAEKMTGGIPADIRKARSEMMRKVLETSQNEYQKQFLGQIEKVLWERSDRNGNDWRLEGLTDTYLRVKSIASQDCRNMISNVKLVEVSGKKIIGEITDRYS